MRPLQRRHVHKPRQLAAHPAIRAVHPRRSIIREGVARAGYQVHGGVNAPYIWLKVPGGMTSWQFFDKLLKEAHVVGTPGSGFGSCGEGYFRLSAFGFWAKNAPKYLAECARQAGVDSVQPTGVHGRGPASPSTSLPRLVGCRPSTSLSGWTRESRANSSSPLAVK